MCRSECGPQTKDNYVSFLHQKGSLASSSESLDPVNTVREGGRSWNLLGFPLGHCSSLSPHLPFSNSAPTVRLTPLPDSLEEELSWDQPWYSHLPSISLAPHLGSEDSCRKSTESFISFFTHEIKSYMLLFKSAWSFQKPCTLCSAGRKPLDSQNNLGVVCLFACLNVCRSDISAGVQERGNDTEHLARLSLMPNFSPASILNGSDPATPCFKTCVAPHCLKAKLYLQLI